MKKSTSLKLKNVPKSQKSISSFFTKSLQPKPVADNPAIKTDLIEKQSVPNNETKNETRNKRRMSSEFENCNKDVVDEIIQVKTNENIVMKSVTSKKLSTLLLKGKYHDNVDQKVPEILVSPSKKIKLSSISNENFKSQNENRIVIKTEEKNIKETKRLDINYSGEKNNINLVKLNEKKNNLGDDECDFLKEDSEDILFLNSVENIECSNNVIDKNSLKDLDELLSKVIDKENSPKKSNLSHKDVFDKKLFKSPLKVLNSCNIEDFEEKQSTNDVKNLEEDFENLDDSIFQDDFIDEWGENNFSQDSKILDLTSWQRCEVLEYGSSECHTKRILRLKDSLGEVTAECWLQGFWMDARIQKGDTISLIAVRSPGNANIFLVNDLHGLLVTRPDLLISGTTVMGSLFCKRKAILQDRFRGVDAPNKFMIIGSLVHQLFQVSLSKQLSDLEHLRAECEKMMSSQDVVYSLHDASVDPVEITQDVMKYAPQILSFIDTYVKGNKSSKTETNGGKQKKWEGKIESIVDIEENIWSPHIGLKGKIDVTLEVTVHDRKKGKEKRLMPLELKTGRASVSAEHRGQVILYSMMLEKITHALKPHNAGLLLYLKDTIGVHEISAGVVEKRDLIMLRNDLAYYLSKWTASDNVAEDGDHGGEKGKRIVELPDPINHHSACKRCPYLTICSVYLNASGFSLPNANPLKELQESALAHLTPAHMSYFLHWTHLICLEEREATTSKPLKDIWTLSPQERQKRGKCVMGAKVTEAVVQEGDRYYHCFSVNSKDASNVVYASGLQVGEYAVISTKKRFALAAGTVVQIQENMLSMILERDLTKRNDKDTLYNIDTYESQSIVMQNLTNLGLLVENDDVANNLRSIIIDKRVATFNTKISSSIVMKSKDILRKLNPVQQRAVLKALATNDYLLIRGMPGTGKTQTIVALIEILYRLGKEVLITSHTHSAVDNIFLRLKDSNMKLLRLGSSKRIHKDLLCYSEGHLMQGNPQDLIDLYSKAQIVGVTCLGSNHSLLTKRCFDVCIVDESTQVLQPSILRPLFAAKKFVLVGDPDQLPPIVRSNRARILGLDESLFYRLHCEASAISLSLQYRMNAPIMNLANHLTYNGVLQAANETIKNTTLFFNVQKKDVDQVESWLQPCISDSLKDSVIFMDTGNTSGQHLNSTSKSAQSGKQNYTNVYEATIVNKILVQLIELGIESNQIGVITPYRDQVVYLREKCQMTNNAINRIKDAVDDPGARLQAVEINTVDQFQGRDKKVVIFSCAKSRTNEENSSLKSTKNEILEDHRRLTVAVTRAKHKLIIVGDGETLQRYTPFRKLIQGIEEFGTIVKLTGNEIV